MKSVSKSNEEIVTILFENTRLGGCYIITIYDSSERNWRWSIGLENIGYVNVMAAFCCSSLRGWGTEHSG